MAGALIDGIQSNHIISTVKHYAVNDQETLRTTLDVTISAAAMRQSDLLAFELAIEKGSPGSVMCSYNLINGRWGCENDYLLNKVLKHDWGYQGFVMSDWGAVHSTVDAANDGLDQFTGFCCVGDKPWFAPPAMKAALQSGAISEKRLNDMVGRILWAMFAKGPVDFPVRVAPIDYAANAAVSQKAAEESLVLLKNDGDLLPLRGVKSIAVIGGSADKGVLAGAGSSDVTPVGGAVMIDGHTYLPSPPLDALRHELPRARIAFDAGTDPAAAAALAAQSDVAIVFLNQHLSEGSDHALELTGNQDALVAAVAKANPEDHRRRRDRRRDLHALGEPGPGDPGSLLPRHSRRPGDRADPDRQGQPVRPSADQLPGLGRPARATGHRRSRRARRNARRRCSTMKARRSATNGTT